MPEVNQIINGNKLVKNELGIEGNIVSMTATPQLTHTQERCNLWLYVK